MPEFDYPGVYVEETGSHPKPIEGVPTSSAAFLGECDRGPTRPQLVTCYRDYQRSYGSGGPFLAAAVRGFFDNGGKRAFIQRLTGRRGAAPALSDLVRGLAALEAPECKEIALVAAPGIFDPGWTAKIAEHCENHARFAVIDCPRGDPAKLDPRSERASRHAAAYAPWLKTADGWTPPSGHLLGIYARVDATLGVWKAPANEPVIGALGLEHAIGDAAQGPLNQRGVNVIRSFPGRGIRVWGARTLAAEREWQYVSVRRLGLYVSRSVDRGTQWVVFEHNCEAVWEQVRRQVWNFLFTLWRAGGLLGMKPEVAFYVATGRQVMTQGDIDNGRLIVEIGIATVRPAEFVIIRIGQWTADRRG
jgi:phage tail sheath protein FI